MGIEVVCVVAMGDPVEAIVQRAHDDRVDAIVMATHGRTGFAQFLFGSVAARVIGAPPPVIVVAGRLEQ
jgi:nucleotide-binding universal stress UspA family protein